MSGIGGAISDIFGGIGGLDEAAAYKKAAQIASENAQLSGVSTRIQEVQTARQAYQVIGAQQAEVGGAGFAASGGQSNPSAAGGGSAGDLLRSSAQQAALAKGLVNVQGTITQQGFVAQAAAYQGQAAAAQAQGAGGIFGGILGAIGSVFSFL